MPPAALLKPRTQRSLLKFGESVAAHTEPSQSMVDTVIDLNVADVLQARSVPIEASTEPQPAAAKTPPAKKRRMLPKWALLLGMALSFFVPGKTTLQRLLTGSSNGSPTNITWVQPPPPDPSTGLVSHRNVVNNLNQYSTNGCGTTSLAMAQNTVTETHSFNREVMDREVRRADIYTTPESMIYAAKTYGAYAEIYNNQQFEDIQRHVDVGNPVIVLIQQAKRGEFQFSGHYVVVSGYKVHPNGKRELLCEDPATGMTSTRDFEYFEKSWGELDYGTVKPGFNNLMIVLSKTPLPPSNYGYNPLSTMATNAANLIHTSTSILSLDGGTLMSRDVLNGNLLRLALLLAGGVLLVKPRRKDPADADSQEAKPDTTPVTSVPSSINKARPAYRPRLTEWLSANDPMVTA